MEAGTRRNLQIGILIVFLAAAVRVGLIWKERHDAETVQPAQQTATAIPKDAFVNVPKFYGYDLPSAKKELVGKNIWVAAADQMYYYPVQGNKVDWAHDRGLLQGMDELKVQNVIDSEGPTKNVKQGDVIFHVKDTRVALIFTHANDSARYAVPIGSVTKGSYDFNVNGAFFLEDPHQLYSHWTPEVWNTISSHGVTKGMSELQTGLSLGPSKPVSGTEYGNRTVQYTSGGKTYTVTFRDDHATTVESSGQAAVQ